MVLTGGYYITIHACMERLYVWLPLVLLMVQHTLADNWINADGSIEYCETEMFSAECPHGEVILMQSASYGRMKFGRCVDRDYGYVGCAANVLHIADRWCSGRRKCEIPVPNSEFRRTQPCPKDLKPYFEASFICVPVQGGMGEHCDMSGVAKVRAKSGYLAKVVAVESGLGKDTCPWLIEGGPGQVVRIILYDFSLMAWEQTNLVNNDGICRVTAIIREKGETRGARVCGGKGREREVFTSEASAIEISMRGVADADRGHFLLKFDILGCSDPEPQIENAWVMRHGTSAEIGCNNSDRKWKVICQEDSWVGQVGNCTEDIQPAVGRNLSEVMLGSILMPFEVSIIIIVAIAFAIGIVILSLGLICLRWRIKKRNQAKREAEEKIALPPTSNGYNVKPPRQGYQSQDSFPPPPPEVDRDSFSATENEYAYISEMPPPPLPIPVPPVVPPGAHTRNHNSVIEGNSLQSHNRKSGLNSTRDNGRAAAQTYFEGGSKYPYSHAPIGYPKSNSRPVTPKFLAHECAMAVNTGDSLHHHQGSPRIIDPRSPRPRSRLPSDISETPTYYELEAQASNQNGVLTSYNTMTSTLPGNSPKNYRAYTSSRNGPKGKNTL